MTSRDLLRFGIIDEVIPEPLGGAHRDYREITANIKSFLLHALRQLKGLAVDELLDRRYRKYRKIGAFVEGAAGADRNGQAVPGSAPD
jgi:acetyl-CoA carboxylase carboxyl transferase subunit alpha